MSTNTNVREIVRQHTASVPSGYGHVVEQAIVALEASNLPPRQVIESVLSDNGLTGYLSYAEPVIAALSEDGPEATVTDDFDKEQAAAVIRAFLIGEEDYTEGEVKALLVLAGIEEEEPEPEPEVTDEAGVEEESIGDIARRIEATVNGLVQFARQHGYRG
jgi:hypothetical protein